ncbi:gall11 coactivator [Fusarium sp. NRRL 25303]|nr:gall11 coactivator [Fusarium sp. NRRL 25303]
MATNAQIVTQVKPMVEPATPQPTLNQLMHIVYQTLAKDPQGCAVSSWQAMVDITDRQPGISKLITNGLLATDNGDPMKVTEWSCNFELEIFHKSVSKELYHQEISQKIQEFSKQRKDSEPTLEALWNRYGIAFLPPQQRPKTPADVKDLLVMRRKRVWHCMEPDCELSTTKFKTKKALQQHINEEHTKPREDPLEYAQENLGLAVEPELNGRELDTGVVENLAMPSSDASRRPPVPCTPAQDRTQGDKAHRSSLSADLGKGNQPQQIATRGVRDGRIVRPSATNKASRRDRQANLSSRGLGK